MKTSTESSATRPALTAAEAMELVTKRVREVLADEDQVWIDEDQADEFREALRDVLGILANVK